jgi:hypothetical protein
MVEQLRPFTKIISGMGETSHGPNMQWIDTDSRFAMDKLASVGTHVPPALAAKIAELVEVLPSEKVAFYNRALGSFESYGLNRNGDGFARGELMRKHATFVSDGHYFRHHKNKDPSASYGRPVASAFNDKTDIVDLIIVGDKLACLDEIHRLERHESVPTSMGAKVAFDTCTICDHRARNRGEYCEHVKVGALHPYGMNQVLDDGRVCGVMNPDPRFFDISKVLVGAAPESEHLMKVASFRTLYFSADAPVIHSAVAAERAGLAPKTAEEKSSAMVKEVPGQLEAAAVGKATESEPDIPESVIGEAVDRGGVQGLMRNTAAMGMVLKPKEFRRGMESATGKKLADFNPPSNAEIEQSQGLNSDILDGDVDDHVLESLSPLFSGRSAFQPALANRATGATKIAASSSIEKRAGVADDSVRDMYVRYRAELNKSLDKVGSLKADFWISKTAGTSGRMFTNLGRFYVKLAYVDAEKTQLKERVLLKMKKVAKKIDSADNQHAVEVTGSIAEEIGGEALDLLTVEIN